MKWSLFNWKKPVVSSGEPEDYQVVKNTVSQNERNITNINSQITNVNNQLNNTVTTNTAQTITGAKTFNEGITINKSPIPLLLKATSSEKNYVVFRDSANNSNLSIGANATSSAIEVNRGNLEIQTQQDNKNISFNTGKVKFNRSVVEFGTEINAGYGGGVVKFIPEDNSTKTLQFYNSGASDTRRFKLAVPEPVDNNNPATKQYVDTKETTINNNISNINNQINTVNQRVSNLINGNINELNEFKTNTVSSLGYNLKYQDIPFSITPTLVETTNLRRYEFFISTLQETKFMSAVIHYKGQSGGENTAKRWAFNYATTWGPKIYFTLTADLTYYTTIDWSQTFVRIFYIDTLNTLTTDPYTIGIEEVNNEN